MVRGSSVPMTYDETPRDCSDQLPNIDATESFEPGDADSLTHSIVSAVSSALEVDHRELDPLYSTMDPGAMAKLCTPSSSEHNGHICFNYSGCAVIVHGGGRVEVSAL